ncbi:hypothetical protein UPYG_G00109120 [Umbra pygmaea]|uniref:Uncharacterized protein n=1 Tax=Umbra pygmaea TaxID=75934 RepID=A0ABD0X2N5_UMBPY
MSHGVTKCRFILIFSDAHKVVDTPQVQIRKEACAMHRLYYLGSQRERIGITFGNAVSGTVVYAWTQTPILLLYKKKAGRCR